MMAEFVEYTEPIWRGLNMRQLKVDQSFLCVQSLFQTKTYLYQQSDECYTVCESFPLRLFTFPLLIN